MVVDLHSLKKDIEGYPNKLHAALLKERNLEDRVETLQEELRSLEGRDFVPPPTRPSLLRFGSQRITLHNDPELIKLKRDKERLRQKKFAEISKNPTAYELSGRATQKMIEATVAQDSALEALQRKIEEREDLLYQQIEQQNQQAEQQTNTPEAQVESTLDPATIKELNLKQKQLEKAEEALQEASIEREVIENALPRMYELLVMLSQVK